MPPRASETIMVSRGAQNQVYDTRQGPPLRRPIKGSATDSGPTFNSSYDSKGTSSSSSIKHNGTPRRRRRPNPKVDVTVNFSLEIIKTIEVEHMEDLPGEDIWYSREEYDDIKLRNSYIVRLIKAGEFEENEEFSCRGLEHKLKEVFRQRRANKFNALNAVLEEQDRQINRGITDAVLISAAYQSVSLKCQESANTTAFRDYRFSFNYDPSKPATGLDQPIPPPEGRDKGLGDSQSSSSKPKEKKKDKKKREKKEKKKEKKERKEREKERQKEQERERQRQKEIEIEVSRVESEDEDDDDPTLSPKQKKKGKIRKVKKMARRIGRRMSM